MPRIQQGPGVKGSQKWIQKLVNEKPDLFNSLIRTQLDLPSAEEIHWHFPLAEDGFAEYQDQAFIKGQDIERFVNVISNEEAAKNDYNLSPSRYVDTSEKEDYRPIPEVFEELRELEREAKKIDVDLEKIFTQTGFK